MFNATVIFLLVREEGFGLLQPATRGQKSFRSVGRWTRRLIRSLCADCFCNLVCCFVLKGQQALKLNPLQSFAEQLIPRRHSHKQRSKRVFTAPKGTICKMQQNEDQTSLAAHCGPRTRLKRWTGLVCPRGFCPLWDAETFPAVSSADTHQHQQAYLDQRSTHLEKSKRGDFDGKFEDSLQKLDNLNH